MSLEFGNLQVVEKTFSRSDVGPRGQAYQGIKFRRSETNKGGKKAIEEKFRVSDALFTKLELESLAATQAKLNGVTYLLIVEDQDEVKPVAKFLKGRKDSKKGKYFTNEEMVAQLVEAGILKADVHGNQYLAVNDVTADISGLPSVVKKVFTLSVDSTVDESKDVEDTKAEAETANAEKEF